MIKKIILSILCVLSIMLISTAQASASEAEVVKDVTAKVESTVVAVEATKTENTVTPEKALSEDQIPLKIEAVAKTAEAGSQTSKLFLSLLMITGMLAAGYFFIRKYAYSNKLSKSNTQIKILAQHHLGPKKTLAIVRVAGESILIGVTDQNISMIKSLSLIDDEIPTDMSQPQNFSQALAEQTVESKSVAVETLAEDIEDDFSFAGIKSNVSQKLKSMRNIQ